MLGTTPLPASTLFPQVFTDASTCGFTHLLAPESMIEAGRDYTLVGWGEAGWPRPGGAGRVGRLGWRRGQAERTEVQGVKLQLTLLLSKELERHAPGASSGVRLPELRYGWPGTLECILCLLACMGPQLPWRLGPQRARGRACST